MSILEIIWAADFQANRLNSMRLFGNDGKGKPSMGNRFADIGQIFSEGEDKSGQRFKISVG